MEWAVVALGAIVLLSAIAALNQYYYSTRSEWHVVHVYKSVRLMSGEMSKDNYLWGRRIRKQWQYRAMSTEEYNEHAAFLSF